MAATFSLTREALCRAADAKSFDRGEGYYDQGRVGELVLHNGVLSAEVQGNEAYQVKLWNKGTGFGFSCSCPMGDDGIFCKHCVALGLAWLGRKKAKGKQEPVANMDEVRDCLSAHDKGELVEMLVDQAVNDEGLRRKLLLKSAQKKQNLDLSAYRKAINAAVNIREFVGYSEMHGYARGLWEMVKSLGELLETGLAKEAIELSEYALSRIEKAMGSMDDSDGHMSGIIEGLQDLHHRACKLAKPDPEALAERLFRWEMTSDWEIFHGAAKTYADVLGEKGLAVYRKLAEPEWKKVRPMKPGENNARAFSENFAITSIMEALARDTEELVEIKKKDLSLPYHFLEIAEIYKQDGKNDLALEWAEQGVQVFPDKIDDRLHEFLANEYHARNKHDEAMELAWQAFCHNPCLDRYQSLKRHADWIRQWQPWREKAIAFFRKELGKKDRMRLADSSELVRGFLWEKDVEAAWREAKEGNCSENLWLEIAEKRAKSHPDDAFFIYQQRVENMLLHANNSAYREAMKVIAKMARLKQGVTFQRYLSTLREKYKLKRNFMALLDAAY